MAIRFSGRFFGPFAVLYGAALALACAMGTPASAASESDGLFISGNTRLRFEAIDGQTRAAVNPTDQWTSLRTVLHVGWRHDNVQLVGEVWDSRVYGANPGSPLSSSDVNTIEPVQAYVQIGLGPVLGKNTATVVQAGRMMLNLGSRRLVAADDYRNTTNGYTGVRVETATKSGFNFNGFYAMPQLRLPDDGASLRGNVAALDKESTAIVLWGGFLAHQRKGKPFLAELSYVHFGERDQPDRPTRDRSLNNAGARFSWDPRAGHFDGGAEAIYQWGEISSGLAVTAARWSVSATFLRAHLGYTFAGKWKPHVLAEFDRASGDGSGSTYGRFDTLYGFRRGDLGPAGLYSELGRTNIMTPGIRVEITPSKRFDAFIGYRALWLADSRDSFSSTAVRDATGRSGDFAGHQIDSRARRWLIPNHLRAEVNAALLVRGRFLETAPNAPKKDTRYVSIALSAFF